MTILEVINNLENKSQILKFLGELFGQSNLTNFGLLEKFLNMNVYEEELLEQIDKEGIIKRVGNFYELQYVLIAKLLLKDLVDNELKTSMDLVYVILEGKSNKQIFKDLFQQRINKFGK